MTAPSIKVAGKAAVYLLERRVQVNRASDDAFRAYVQGSEARPYVVTCVFRVWACTCRAGWQGRYPCAHIIACQAVWAPTEPSAAERAESAERGLRVLERVGATEEKPW